MASLSYLLAAALSLFGRLYVYGIHGFAVEVAFTAAWDLLANSNVKLQGGSSLWCFFIYGLSCLMIERLHDSMAAKGVPLMMRVLVYVLWTYTWELCTGLILRQFNACPWDYTAFSYNFMGLITFEYFPAWFFANIFHEKFIMLYTRRLCLSPDVADANRKPKM